MSNWQYVDMMKRREYGDEWDTSELHEQFRQFFTEANYRESRVRVAGGTWDKPYVRTGLVKMTDGPKPRFVLEHRRGEKESTDFLGRHDLVVAIQDEKGGPYRELETGKVNWHRCAYCSAIVNNADKAGGPWHWPGKGMVVNCKRCAGIVRCERGHEYDSTIAPGFDCLVCDGLRDYSDALKTAGRAAIYREREKPQAVVDAALHLLELLGYGTHYEFKED